MGRLTQFRTFREKMNERIRAAGNLPINRFFTLDTKAYEDGALDARTKELAGRGDRLKTGPTVAPDLRVRRLP